MLLNKSGETSPNKQLKFLCGSIYFNPKFRNNSEATGSLKINPQKSETSLSYQWLQGLLANVLWTGKFIWNSLNQNVPFSSLALGAIYRTNWLRENLILIIFIIIFASIISQFPIAYILLDILYLILWSAEYRQCLAIPKNKNIINTKITVLHGDPYIGTSMPSKDFTQLSQHIYVIFWRT